VTSQLNVSHNVKARTEDLPADACEASNTEDFTVSDDGHGASGALKLLTAQQGGLVEHRRSAGGCHNEKLVLALLVRDARMLSLEEEQRAAYSKKCTRRAFDCRTAALYITQVLHATNVPTHVEHLAPHGTYHATMG